jgi:hypothetical protein
MKALAALLTVLAVSLLLAAAARGDGYPLGVQDVGPEGIADSAGEFRYITLDDGRETLLTQVEQDGGKIAEFKYLGDLFFIPVVGLDGSPSGLAADGGTLVLISPRPDFPRETTEFLVFDTQDIRHPRTVELDGDYSFDALSPDGRTMYLINYTSPRDPTEYDVRAFDLERERLVPGAITDPDEPGDEMFGYALSRVTSPDGRFAYTLYLGQEHPFIHALDTVEGTAACIDLDDVPIRPNNMYAATLEPGGDGTSLVVNKFERPVAIVDAETHEVSRPDPEPVADRPSNETAGAEPEESSIAPIAILAGAAMAGIALALAWRRRGRSAT